VQLGADNNRLNGFFAKSFAGFETVNAAG